MEEIYILARESLKGGQESFEVHAFPFHMTNENINRHRRNKWTPFWRNLKKGYDHFEVVKQPPPVEVCEKRYLVNVAFVDGDTDIDPRRGVPDLSAFATQGRAASADVPGGERQRTATSQLPRNACVASRLSPASSRRTATRRSANRGRQSDNWPCNKLPLRARKAHHRGLCLPVELKA